MSVRPVPLPAVWTEQSKGLLSRYDVGRSVLFTSPRHTLLTSGVRGIVTGDLATLPERVPAALAGGGGIAAGAIAFDGTARLTVPATVDWSGPPTRIRARTRARPSGWRMQCVPDPEAYREGVRRALRRIDEGSLAKVVLARSVELFTDGVIDVREFLAYLIGRAHHSFAVPLGDRTLIGASPELLVSRRGRTVAANPLAGSTARSPLPHVDRQRALDLLASAKDRHEHRLVVDAVADALRPYCARLQVPREPELISTTTMWHLSTKVSGRLRDPDTSSLTLAAALHPTPAVCGTPTEEARSAIRDLEPFDRGFYTGMVGWSDASGDGEWAVAIRCAEVFPDAVRLFAGAGIVVGSDPDSELAETSAKFHTLMQALGITTDV
ncbi:isochorismate synthase [Streptosporangium sp. KLBMP 9127]|nr:isochorismate synthase [Streptosporangium sp. KLBMP 9127]